MTRTLIDMEAQFRDISEMHNKMEREYPNLQNVRLPFEPEFRVGVGVLK